jgi:hypothetical protein
MAAKKRLKSFLGKSKQPPPVKPDPLLMDRFAVYDLEKACVHLADTVSELNSAIETASSLVSESLNGLTELVRELSENFKKETRPKK